MRLIDKTPKTLLCAGLTACPAVFETPEGDYILIGRHVQNTPAMHELSGRIGPGEIAVRIPRELLSDLLLK